jgi:polynucleotide 5'-triphosphatase
MIRRKDRVTYTHQIFQIDLTQVTASNPGQAPQPPTHELEVEFRHSKELMRVLAKNDVVTKNEEFVELVRVFVNNIRILVRNCI